MSRKKNVRTTNFQTFKRSKLSKYPELKKLHETQKNAESFVARVRSKLRSLRVIEGGKQRDLAESMGVSQPVVSRIETDESADMTLVTLYRYAAALGMRPVLSFAPAAGIDSLDKKISDHNERQRNILEVIAYLSSHSEDLNHLAGQPAMSSDELIGAVVAGMSNVVEA